MGQAIGSFRQLLSLDWNRRLDRGAGRVGLKIEMRLPSGESELRAETVDRRAISSEVKYLRGAT